MASESLMLIPRAQLTFVGCPMDAKWRREMSGNATGRAGLMITKAKQGFQEDGLVLWNGVLQTRVWSRSVRESVPRIRINAGKSGVCGRAKRHMGHFHH